MFETTVANKASDFNETPQPYLLNPYEYIDYCTHFRVVTSLTVISIPMLIDCVGTTRLKEVHHSQWHNHNSQRSWVQSHAILSSTYGQ